MRTGQVRQDGRYCRELSWAVYKEKFSFIKEEEFIMNMKKIAALAMAVAMCLPMSAFAAQSVEMDTDFDIYSPVLEVNLPVKADVKVNPLADKATTSTDYTVSSNSIDVVNKTVDNGKGIPVNVTAQATVAASNQDVVVLYDYANFTEDDASKTKKISLQLAEPNMKATVDATGKIATHAAYDTPTNTATITKYGSLLSVNVAAPAVTGGTATPTVNSFAVVGKANPNANWMKGDVTVGITYTVKASKPVTVTTPTVAPVTVAAGADASIVIPNVGEAKVVAFAVHNDEAGYKDYVWTELDKSVYEITYAPNATITTQTDATIKIDKADPGLVFLAGADNGCQGKAQDLIIALSDGRFVVSTFTAN